ncbi:MAG: hypothetical protein U1F65_03745 [Verrucomicrobiota bacterium]
MSSKATGKQAFQNARCGTEPGAQPHRQFLLLPVPVPFSNFAPHQTNYDAWFAAVAAAGPRSTNRNQTNS